MKKLVCILLIVIMMLGCAAFAKSYGFVGDMKVVNCKEWVSLRAEPSTESERIAKIPLGSIVNTCTTYSNGWVRGTFFGKTGYIAGDYLVPAEAETVNTGDFYVDMYGAVVVGSKHYGDNDESYTIEVFGEDGTKLWDYTAYCSYVTELEMTDVFIGGTDARPLVMAFSAEDGLTALDFYTGEEVWNIPDSTLSLGGSICHTVDENGNMYIGGYYGPDPVAISMHGEILWQTDFQGAYYWLYDIEIVDDSLICSFEMDDTTYEAVTVQIAKNGNFMGIVY